MEINTLTLMMLILMIGMLVDDAIVTSESIYAHREKGMDPQEASIEGRATVAGPVIVSITLISTALRKGVIRVGLL